MEQGLSPTGYVWEDVSFRPTRIWVPSSGFGTLCFWDLNWGPAVLVRVGTWGDKTWHVDLSGVGGAVSEDPKNPKNLDEGKTLMFHYYLLPFPLAPNPIQNLLTYLSIHAAHVFLT